MLLAFSLFVLAAAACSKGPEVRGPFRGQVVDAETRQPLAGVVVVLSWHHETLNYGPRVYDARESVTDREGRFEVAALQGLIWRPSVRVGDFRMFKPGYRWTRKTQVTPSDGREFVDPTVTTMEKLTNRAERLDQMSGPANVLPFDVPHEKMPNFLRAIDEERASLGLPTYYLERK